MKRKLYTSLLMLITTVILKAQTSQLNLQKYWWYRCRMMNDFVIKGDCQGCSEIINERDHRPKDDPTIGGSTAKWGDQSFNLGEYIAVLATEFKLLQDNGQPTDTTLQELAYAIKAFNRLDLYAEVYYAQATGATHIATSADLNGFWVRDDVPANFLDIHPGLKNGDISDRYVNIVDSDFQDAMSQIPDFAGKTFCMSHDQIWPIFMGMAMIRKYLNNGDNYQHMALNEVNGNYNIWQEAGDITNRIMDMLSHPGEVMRNWTIVNPVTDNWEGVQGYQLGQMSYAVAEAGCYIKNMNTGIDSYLPALHTCGDYHDVASYVNASLWNEYGSLTGSAFTAIPIDASYEDFKLQMLATIGNSWWTRMSPFYPDPMALLQIFHNPLNIFDPGALQLTLSNIIPLPPVNITAAALYERAIIDNNQHLPLIRQLLHGGANAIPPSAYQHLLDIAPCEGPYNFSRSGGGMSTYEWSSRDRLHVADERGGYVDADHEGSSQGEYPGLDYMLYYNLFTIKYGAGSGVYYTNYMDRPVTYPFPIAGTVGTHANPTIVEAFSTIDASNTINNTADVTYRAGKQIHLGPGFQAHSGATFHAYIDPFECGAGGEYRSTNPSEDNMSTAVAYAGQTTFVSSPARQNIAEEQPLQEPAVILPPGSVNENITTDAEPPKPAALSSIRIFPNPNNGSFQVVFSSDKVNARLTVMNMFGNIVFQQQLVNPVTTIDISSQSKGVYSVRVESEQKVEVLKIIYQ